MRTKCIEKGCEGNIDKETEIKVNNGIDGVIIANPCDNKDCGALYRKNGIRLDNGPDFKAFYEKGHVVIRNEAGKEVKPVTV